MTVVPSLDNTIGAAFLGLCFACMLYGVTNLQVYMYYHTYKKDWALHKISVGLLWVLDTVHLSLTIAAVYHYIISGFGDLPGLQVVHWTYKLGIAVNVVIVLVVQSLYAFRVWRLGRHYQRVWPILVAVVVVAGYAVGILLAVKTYALNTFTDLKPNSVRGPVIASFAVSTFVDFVISIAVCFYLLGSKSSFSSTDNKIIAVVRMTLISGGLTSACSLACLITFITMSNNLIFLGIEFLLTKLYINSFLAMLNARESIRNADSSAGSSWRISRAVTVGGGRTQQPLTSFQIQEGKDTYPLTPVSEYSSQKDLPYTGIQNQKINL